MDFIPSISTEQKDRIRKVFDTMITDGVPGGLYEPESFGLAKGWLEKKKLGVFLQDEWVDTGSWFDATHCCTGEKLATVSLATEETLQHAYAVASKASSSWASQDHQQRATALQKIAQTLEPEKQLFSLLESITTGKPVRQVCSEDFPLLVQSFQFAASLAASWVHCMKDWAPIGVVYIIASGYNYPIMSLCCQVATALAAGNAVVLQADPRSCFSASLLAHVMKKAGLPCGLFNILPGTPTFLCDVKAASVKGLKKIFFSGSYEDAEKLRRWSATNGHQFELIMHAPYQRPTVIVLQEADIDSAVAGVLQLFCYGSPKSKTAGCRVLIQDSVRETFERKLQSKFQELKIGDCLSNADISALADCMNDSLVIQEMKKSGAQVLSLSDSSPAASLVTNLQTSSMLICKQIKGRFLLLIPFRTMKEAINICNHEKSGCDVSIWCEKTASALQLAHTLKVANVWINGQNIFSSSACYGSVYRSGTALFGGQMATFQFVEPAGKHAKKDSKYSVKRENGGHESVGMEEKEGVTAEISKASKKKTIVNKMFKMYYGGAFKLSDGSSVRVICDCDGEEIYQVPEGTRKDIRNAVECTIAAHAKWHSKVTFSRAQILFAVAKGLKESASKFSDLLSELTSRSKDQCDREVRLSSERICDWASVCHSHSGQLLETEMFGKVMQSQEPLGVVGVICPDEFPLLSFVSLVVPVIATGNVTIVVPSEKYPVFALQLCEIFQKCGIPGGVVNVITGLSKSLTVDLSKHMEIEALWVHRDCADCTKAARSSIAYKKNVWISKERNWECDQLYKEFVLHCTYIKTTWIPMGDIFAN